MPVTANEKNRLAYLLSTGSLGRRSFRVVQMYTSNRNAAFPEREIREYSVSPLRAPLLTVWFFVRCRHKSFGPNRTLTSRRRRVSAKSAVVFVALFFAFFAPHYPVDTFATLASRTSSRVVGTCRRLQNTIRRYLIGTRVRVT